MSSNQWTFSGRYGDEEEEVRIKTLPGDLSDEHKSMLTRLYQGKAKEYFDCGVGVGGYKLEEMGLARQVGNAWHHRIVFAPQVHEWMSGKNDNDTITAELRAQYTG